MTFSQDDFVKSIGKIFLLHPLWWILGIDQFIFAVSGPIFFFAGFYFGIIKLKENAHTILLLLLFSFQLLSLTNLIFEPNPAFYAQLFFFKTGLSLSAFFNFLIIVSCVNSANAIRYLLKCFVFQHLSSMLATIAGYLLFKNGLSQFPTLSYFIAPNSIKNLNLFYPFFVKGIIMPTELLNYTAFRTKGLFLYSNLFSIAMENMVFISLILAIIEKEKRYYLFSGLCLLFVILSTSRAGIISLFAGLSLILPFYLLIKRSFHFLLPSIFIVLIISLLAYINVSDSLSENVYTISHSRGYSFETRNYIYQKSIELIQEHPFLGWGTNRKIHSDLAYAGSHSTYLSVAFKNGIIGLFLFLTFLGVILKNLFSIKPHASNNSLFSPLVIAMFVSAVIQQMAHMIVLDINDDIFVLNQILVFWGICMVLSDLQKNNRCEDNINEHASN